MSSLKTKLHDIVISKGFISYGDFVNYCLEEGFKPSNGERRFREICEATEAEIEPTRAVSKRGNTYISGWRRKEIKILGFPVKFIDDLPPDRMYFESAPQNWEIRKIEYVDMKKVNAINSIPLHKAESNQTKLF